MTTSSELANEEKTSTWHQQSAEAAMDQLKTSAAGLAAPEAARRLAADGPNELREAERISPLQILAGQFKSLIVWILIGAGVVSGAVGEAVDAIAILAIVALNAAIGFYQEFNAERSIAALQKMTAPQCKVRRDGNVIAIAANDLVAGDILQLEAGDLVAADARLLSSASLRCVEAALTGESEAADKNAAVLKGGEIALAERENMVFLGTSVAAGAGQAVAVATGMRTELGHIAKLIDDAGENRDTPLQKKLDSFGRVLLYAASAIVALLFLLGMLRGVDTLELFMTSISLAVAAIPEGLPSVVTVALSVGVTRLARRGALTRKLAKVETLGSTNVICTDKTGTLTAGQMTARALYVDANQYEVTGEGYGPAGEIRLEGKKVVAQAQNAPLRELATVLLACNNAHLNEADGVWTALGDPTEAALLAVGLKAGGDRARIEAEMPKESEIPFDSGRKRSSVTRRMPDGKRRAFVNGAPGAVLEGCTRILTGAFQGRGVVHAVARHRHHRAARLQRPHDPQFVICRDAGVHANVRRAALQLLRRHLVQLRARGRGRGTARGDPQLARDRRRRAGMVAGDHHHADARAAALLDGLLRRRPRRIVHAGQPREHQLGLHRFRRRARRIVAVRRSQHPQRSLRHRRRGADDQVPIPFHHRPHAGADIGIAMGVAGTEVTKQAADLIITDDNFATIVAAVEEGRGIYANIRKTLQYLLAGNTAELLLMAICVAWGLPAPLLPIHLLWINLVTDGLPALCLASDPADADLMREPPRSRAEQIAGPAFLRTMFFTGLVTAALGFAVYFHALQTKTVEAARGSAFAVVVFAELLRAFGARSEAKPVWHIPLSTNVNLVLVVAFSFGLLLLSQHNNVLGAFLKTPPMAYAEFLTLLALGLIPLLAVEAAKLARSRKDHL